MTEPKRILWVHIYDDRSAYFYKNVIEALRLESDIALAETDTTRLLDESTYQIQEDIKPYDLALLSLGPHAIPLPEVARAVRAHSPEARLYLFDVTDFSSKPYRDSCDVDGSIILDNPRDVVPKVRAALEAPVRV